MQAKKMISTFLVLFLFVLTGIYFLPPVKAFVDYNVYYLNSDKHEYYIDETIYLNFSGYLEYDPQPPIVDGFFQICIVNSSGASALNDNAVLWNSSEFHDDHRIITEEFYLNILNIGPEFLSSNTTHLYIKVHYYYFDIYVPEDSQNIYLEQFTKEITINKRGSSCQQVHYLNTDKDEYFIDETVILNASWTLDYESNPLYNDVFMQACLFNDSDSLIWNSSEYRDLTTVQIVEPIILSDLSLSELNTTCTVKLRLYYFFYENDTDDLYLEDYTCSFNVTKRGSSCINVHYLNTDKEAYFTDNVLHLNASWTLNYTAQSPPVDAFIQICLLNSTDYLIWNSSEYHDITTMQVNEEFILSTMDLYLSKNSTAFYFKFRLFYFFSEIDTADTFLEDYTYSFNITKRGLSCVQGIYLNIDKNDYLIDESIHLNASWTLNYTAQPPPVDAFIQICLLNSTGFLIWNSSEYHDITTMQINKEFILSTMDLFLSRMKNPFQFKLRLFYYFHERDTADLYLEEYSCSFNISIIASSYVKIHYMNIDKEEYYINEIVQVNASWIMNQIPSPPLVDAFLQICLFNESNALIWNSSEYRKTYPLELLFDLNLSELNPFLYAAKTGFYLKVRLFSSFGEELTEDLFLEEYTCSFDVLKIGLSCLTVYYLSTDKETYYMDDILYMNASWTLNYTAQPLPVDAFLQICLFNSSDALVWNSSEYHDITTELIFEELHLIDLNLPLPMPNNLYHFKLRFCYYFHESDRDDSYLETFTYYFNLSKKGSSCLSVHDLTLDNQDYFLNDTINLHASWTLNYTAQSPSVYAFIQICLLNSTGFLIWNSVEYHTPLYNEVNLEVNLSTLNIIMVNSTNLFFFKIHLYYYFHENDTDDLYMEDYTFPFNISIVLESCMDVNHFKINKENFQYGEKIILNASWIIYNSYDLNPSVQIWLIDDDFNVIWKSIKYNDLGTMEENIIIPTSALTNCTIYNTRELEVIIIFLYLNKSKQECYILKNSLLINVHKGKISYELNAFQDVMEYGEDQKISIHLFNFFDTSVDIKNGTLELLIKENNELLSKKSFFLEGGQFSFKLSYKDLSIGTNSFWFNLTNVFNHENYCFKKNITMNKMDVILKVVNVTLKEKQLLGLVSFLYVRNGIQNPLQYENITIYLYNQTILLMRKSYITNNLGNVEFNMSLESPIKQNKTLILKFQNKGNSTLASEDNIVKIPVSAQFSNQDAYRNSTFLSIGLFISVIGMMSIVIITILKKNVKEGAISLKEHHFKY